MKTCSICGTALQDDNQFCTSCGAKNEAMSEAEKTIAASPETTETKPFSENNAPDAETPLEAASDFTAQSAAPSDAQDSTSKAEQTAAAAQQGAANAGSAQPMDGSQPAYSAQSTYSAQPVPPYGQTYQQPYAGAGYQPIAQENYQQCEPVTMGQWLLNYLIMAVPVVNLVMLFIWGFGGSTKLSQRNWARATLIWMAIGIAVAVLLVVFFGVLMFSEMSSYAY
ncbi:MAG: zinc-ribbon domain-containing protein [Ruthenibacterium sp.]